MAYEMLGSAADAEDVLQDSWLRWSAINRQTVRDPRAYLIRIVARQSLNLRRTLARRREEYAGEWLPEPLLTSPDIAEDVEFAESVSIAVRTVLETFGPAERAVFVLREVFDVPFPEIAAAVGKSPAATRQIAHRAKQHVTASAPRVQVAVAEHERIVERMMHALNSGDVQALMDVLAPDVVAIGDGGGKVQGAARRPVVGADRITRWLAGSLAKADGVVRASATMVNGVPAVRVEIDGQLVSVAVPMIQGGLITKVYGIANPDKLQRLDAEVPLTR